jgi:(p)ppGpp synthase/HD superfamily hydrolase
MLTDRYREALGFAFDLHRAQSRKGSGIPYVAHLIGVSSLALEHGADEDEAIAALLHDAVEDQGGPPTLAAIRTRFGDRVAAIVAGCTDADSVPKPPWRDRKERYLAHLVSASPSVVLVSSCDKLYNARSIVADLRRFGPAVWDRFTGGRDGSLWYYRSLAAIFTTRGAAAAAELARTVAEIDALCADEGSRH